MYTAKMLTCNAVGATIAFLILLFFYIPFTIPSACLIGACMLHLWLLKITFDFV